jgi:Ser/Thr protein kinase RdoA (MazF antagonist)
MDKLVHDQGSRHAAHEALKAFGIPPAALQLAHVSENITFRVTDARDGDAYVLRLHRPGYHDLDGLTSERIWTRALAEAGVAVPRPVVTKQGADYVQVDLPGAGGRRWAGLTQWIEGEVLSAALTRENDPAVRARQFERLGGLMAAMHDQASAWTPPTNFHRHALDADGLMGDTPFWGPFWDHAILTPAQRTLLMATRDKIWAALARLDKGAGTFSVIHADLHAGNLVLDRDRLAVIDFDDAAFGWHAYDLAVALVGYRTDADFEGLREACLRGYGQVRPLTDGILELLPMFMLTRELAQLGWLHQRPEVSVRQSLPAIVESLCARAEGFQAP